MTETEASEPIPEWVRPWNIDGAREALRASMSVRDDSALGRRIRFTLTETAGPIFPRLDLYPELLVVRYRDDLVRLQFRDIGSIIVADNHVVLASGDDEAAVRCTIYPHGELTLALLATSSITNERTRRRR